MNKLFLTIFLVIFSVIGSCATIDTTIFNSDFEKYIFKKYLEGNYFDTLGFLRAVNYNSESDNNIYLIQKICNELQFIKEYKRKKQLSTIFKHVHEKRFRKFSNDTYFNDIFSGGYYNCLTACALYSIILDYFKIPYTIKETTNHVYIIGDPGNTDYMMETTSPTDGLYAISSKDKAVFLEYLYKNKIISEYEYKSKSPEELFNQYYQVDKSINIIELAGLQYFNKGVECYNKSDYEEAIKYFEKSEILYQSDLCRYLKFLSIYNVFSKESNSNQFNGKNLAKLVNLDLGNSLLTFSGRDYFEMVSKELVLNHPNIDKYKKYFHDLITTIDTSKRSDLYQSYYYFMGYYTYLNDDFESSFRYLLGAYSYNPDNIRIKQFLSEVTGKNFSFSKSHQAMIDSIESYYQKFSFLRNDKNLQRTYFYHYGQVILKELEESGLKRLSPSFEKIDSLLRVSKQFDGSIAEPLYIETASFYVRNKKYEMAETVLKFGLNVSPLSEELKKRLNTIQENKESLLEYMKKSKQSKNTKAFIPKEYYKKLKK